MTRKGRGICKNSMITYLAIVGNMDIGHDPIIVSKTSEPSPLDSTAIDSAILANGVTVANMKLCWFAPVFLILRIITNRGKLKDMIIASNPSRPSDDGMRTDPGTGADLHIRTDNGKRTHADILR
jgi:hypothetical protein